MKTHPTLEDLLRPWLARREPSARAAMEARARFRRRLESERFLDLPPTAPLPRRRTRIFAVAGAVAGLALAAAAPVLHRVAVGERLRPAPLTAAELRQRGVVYGAVADLFGAQLDRLDLAPGGLSIVLVQEERLSDAPPDRDARPLIVRFVAVERPEHGAWRTAWTREIIAHEQQVIPLKVEHGGTSEIILWTCPVGDGKIYVDFKLDLAGASPFSSGAVAIVQPGRPHELLMFRASGGECRIYQTIDRLPASTSSGPARSS